MGQDYVPIWVILPVTSIGVFMSALDGSIVNVVLPTIAEGLDTSISGVRWVVIVYLLTISSMIGLAGALGDAYGRKRVFQLGMFIFTLGSLLASTSPSIEYLVAYRALQAIGAAGLQANGLALVVTYINPAKRGRAIGINSLVVAAALTVGPALGGFLADEFGWTSIFLINLPIGIVGLIAVQLVITETSGREDITLDYLGMVLFMFTAFGFISGILLIFDGYTWALLLLLGSGAGAYLFYRNEAQHPHPILSIEVLKKKQIMFGALAAIFSYMAINAFLFLLPFYFQDVRELSQSQVGLYLVVVPLALSLMGPPAGLLAEKIKAKLLATLGSVLQAIMVLTIGILFMISNGEIADWIVLILIALTAASLSLFTNPNGTSIMNASAKEDLSIIAGIISLARNIGFTLGTSLGSAFFVLFQSRYNYLSETAAYTNALGLTFIIFSGFTLVGALISYLRGTEIVVTY